MALKVFSCCTYSTAYRRTHTEDEWAAMQFVRAIKRRPLRGYAHVPLPGGGRGHLHQGTAGLAPEWFGRMVSAGITWPRLGELAFVPVPNAVCGLRAGPEPNTLALARAVVATLPEGKAQTFDLLRWAEPMPSAHRAGGTRDPQELYSRLRLTSRRLPENLPQVVLIDDVLASGAHLRAAAAFLTDCGARVLAACCAAKAVLEDTPDGSPFSPRSDLLYAFYADPDWLLPATSDRFDSLGS